VELTGRPTAFLSHAWKYSFGNLVEALEAFQAAQPEGEPAIFFWIDVCSIDQHKVGGWPQEWWTTTFKEAIGLIGHTVMMLSPWDSPVPLTRSWCLWELYCTVATKTSFSVCLGPSEQKEFENALLEDGSSWSAPRHVLLSAFSKIDIENAEAGSLSDQTMILGAVEETEGGCVALNELAMGEMRRWVHQIADKIVASRTDQADGRLMQEEEKLQEVSRLVGLLSDLDSRDKARQLCAAVVKEQAALLGEGHEMTLKSKLASASLMSDAGEKAEARALFGTIIAALTEQFGETHRSTLIAKATLADCLFSTLQGEVKQDPSSELALEALQLAEQACAGLVEVHCDPKDMLIHRLSLAQLYHCTSNVEEAMSTYKGLIGDCQEVHGPYHFITLKAKNNLANLAHQVGDLQFAGQLFQEVIVCFTEQLGATDSRTLAAKGNLAGLLAQMERFVEARDLANEVVAGLHATVGDQHPMAQHFSRMLGAISQHTQEQDDASAIAELTPEVEPEAE
jgi:hypothetical protein